MSARKKIEELKESINKIIAVKEGIKVAEATSSQMCLSLQQKQCANSVYNEKVLSAIVKVKDIVKKLDDLEETLKSKCNNIKKPEFISPEFRHPLNFLEDLIIYYESIPRESCTVEDIIDCLQGDAKSWAIIFQERWSNIEDFKPDFLKQYWSRAEQTLLKKEIVCGIWDSKHETLAEHFNSLVAQAKWLPNRIPDEVLIFDIMRHFSEHVQTAWATSKQSTIIEATTFLQKIDKEMPSVLKSTVSSINIEPTLQDNMNNYLNDAIIRHNKSRNVHNGETNACGSSQFNELENQTARLNNSTMNVQNQNLVVTNDAFARLETQLEKLAKHMSENNKIHSINKKRGLRVKELKRLRLAKRKTAKVIMNSGSRNYITMAPTPLENNN